MRAVRRDNSAKIDIPMAELVAQVKDMLDNIQQSLFDIAKQKRDACIQTVHTWEEFAAALTQKKMIMAPWCDEEVRTSFAAPFGVVSYNDFLFAIMCKFNVCCLHTLLTN